MSAAYDLIVIGGGPAGTSAAITAARAGWRVLLVERGRFPRHKVCGEFVSIESLTLLKWLLGDLQKDLLQRALTLPQSRLLLDGRVVRVPIDPPAASITRYDLDLALWNAAKNAGVTALQEVTVQAIEGESPFRIASSGGRFCGRAVINATGRWSNLKLAENRSPGTRWLGLKGHFHGDSNPSVDLYFFDGGYCGVQPVCGADGSTLLNACALVRPDVASTLEEVLNLQPLLTARRRSWAAAFAPVSTFPVILRQPVPVFGNVMHAGDAAGFVDPFIGDGIALALRGGNLATRNLLTFLDGRSGLKQSLEGYERVYERSLRPAYRASSLLRRFLGVPRALRGALLSACESSPRLASYLVDATRSKPLELQQDFHQQT